MPPLQQSGPRLFTAVPRLPQEPLTETLKSQLIWVRKCQIQKEPEQAVDLLCSGSQDSLDEVLLPF